MKLHLDSNIVEGTPEELAKYKELSHKTKREVDEEGFDAGNYSILSVEAQAPSTDIQVGDRVKVLKSQNGAEGEATVTAVLEDGDVRLEGKSDNGVYSYKWSNHVSNLEKIEEEIKEARDYVEKVKAKEDVPMGYTFWYINGTQGRRNNVLKASLEGYFEDSTGTRYTYQAVSGDVKPIDNEYARKHFEEAENYGYLLKYYSTVDEFMMLKH